MEAVVEGVALSVEDRRGDVGRVDVVADSYQAAHIQDAVTAPDRDAGENVGDHVEFGFAHEGDLVAVGAEVDVVDIGVGNRSAVAVLEAVVVDAALRFAADAEALDDANPTVDA